MAWEELSDFEQQMYWAVVEESSLAELVLGGTAYVGDGPPIQHGPWEPAACSAHLLHWFDQGLVTLYDSRNGYPTKRPDLSGPTGLIPSEAARQRLASWEHWGDDDEQWMCTRLVVTDKGMLGLDVAVGLGP